MIIFVGNLEEITRLLNQGEDPNSCEYSGSTAMIMAASNKHPEIVELLYKAGASVNARDNNVSNNNLFFTNVEFYRSK